jgi:hypothetical protein
MRPEASMHKRFTAGTITYLRIDLSKVSTSGKKTAVDNMTRLMISVLDERRDPDFPPCPAKGGLIKSSSSKV